MTADDAAYAVLEFANGVFAAVNSSWAVRVNRRELVELHIDGTHGALALQSSAEGRRLEVPPPREQS